MSIPPRDDRIGEALDRAMDRLDIQWDATWFPESRPRSHRMAWAGAITAAAAAAVAALFIPFGHPLHDQQVTINVPVAAAPALPRSVIHTLKTFHATQYDIEAMVPVYTSYPVVNPSAHSYAFNGSFRYDGVTGNALSLVVNTDGQVTNGVLFSQSSPVFSFRVNPNANQLLAFTDTEVIHAAPQPSTLKGTWYQAGSSQLNSFTASGPMVYATHEGYWTSISGQGSGLWQNPPSGTASSETAVIAGLPLAPSHALLVEEASSGLSTGFVTTNAGQTWQPWTLGSVQFGNLVSMQHRYWAVINGSLEQSRGGRRWHPILTLNPAKWQVQDFAINPANPNMLVAALVPIAGDGIGPVLTTDDNGKTWHEIANYPNLGVAPTDMAVLPNGNVSALVALTKPVLIEYHQASQKWQIIPVPRQAMGVGTGQLTAAPNGNLVYGAPGGNIYVWEQTASAWKVIEAPPSAPINAAPANLLEAIGDQEIMAGYQSGWYYFDIAATPTP